MKIIAITNQKGGTAKTTTTVNLAAALGEAKHKTLVVDLDPQSSSSSWLGIKDGGRGLLNALTGNGNLTDLINPSTAAGVDVIPSSYWLASAEKVLANEVGAETLLRRLVERLPQDRWEFLLFDCPPNLGLLSISALVAAREVLVPVEAHVMPLAGLAALFQTVERVRERLNPELSLSAVLACRVDQRTNLSREVLGRLREKFGDLVMKTVIREAVRLAEAPSFVKPITAYDPNGTGAKDYRAAAKELLSRKPRKVAA